MTLIASKRIYTGRVINLDLDTVRFPNGTTGQLELFRHPGAAAVVPFLDEPDEPDPRILLIRQYRHAAGGFIWECPAGRLDSGEDPVKCAHRELEEETGKTAKRLEYLTTIFTTPGFTDERIHLYRAMGLSDGVVRREADEIMEVHALRWSVIMRMIAHHEIVDGKTLIAILISRSFPTTPVS